MKYGPTIAVLSAMLLAACQGPVGPQGPCPESPFRVMLVTPHPRSCGKKGEAASTPVPQLHVERLRPDSLTLCWHRGETRMEGMGLPRPALWTFPRANATHAGDRQVPSPEASGSGVCPTPRGHLVLPQQGSGLLEDAAEVRVVRLVDSGRPDLFVHAADTRQQELAGIAEHGGLARGDAAAGNQHDELAEHVVDAGGGAQVAERAEQVRGEVLGLLALEQPAGVLGAVGRMVGNAVHGPAFGNGCNQSPAA